MITDCLCSESNIGFGGFYKGAGLFIHIGPIISMEKFNSYFATHLWGIETIFLKGGCPWLFVTIAKGVLMN